MNRKIDPNRLALWCVLALIAITFIVYANTFLSMVSVWLASASFFHGILILPMSTYLVWRDRKLWTSIRFRHSALGIALLGLSVSAWLVGALASVQLVSQFAVIGILVALIWSVLGTNVVRVLHFPLLFAFFSVPFGEFLIPKLVDWTADFTVFALQLIAIPVLREGRFFSLPSGNFHVIDACSGIRFLIVTAVLGLYFAHESFSRWRKRVLFILVALVAVIVANWVRAFLVVLVAHYSDMQIGTGHSHIYAGWLIFLLVISSVFWAGRKFQGSRDLDHSSRHDRGEASSPPDLQSNIVHLVGVSVTALVVLLAGPLMLERAVAKDSEPRRHTALPIVNSGWVGPSDVTLGFKPGFSGATEVVEGRYRMESQSVEMFVFFYWREKQGSELVGWQSHLLGDWKWRSDLSRKRQVHIGTEGKLEVQDVRITDGRRRLRVWIWYDIGGRQTTNPWMAKLLQAWNSVFGTRIGDAAIVIIAPDLESAAQPITETLRAFVVDNFGGIQACLRRRAARMAPGGGMGSQCSSASPGVIDR